MRKVLILYLLFPVLAPAQEEDNILEKPSGYEFGEVARSSVSANFGGVCEWAGITYELFLSPQWRIEAGGGFVGAGAGIDYYFRPVKLGALRWRLNFRSMYYLGKAQHAWKSSICAGFTYFTKKRINVGIDIGPAGTIGLAQRKSWEGTTDVSEAPISFTGVVKVGYQFSFIVWKWRNDLKKRKGLNP